MAEVNSLGYVGFGVSDLERWETLLVDVLGLQRGESLNKDSLMLRMDDRSQRITIEKSEIDDILFIGWMFETEEKLENYIRTLTAKGIKIETGSAELAQQRRMEKIYTCLDPNGLRHEFAVGPQYALEPFTSKVLRQGFVTEQLGLGHILIAAKDYDAMREFAKNVLGLRLSDYIRAPLETPKGVINVDATFFHTEDGRHHSFATAGIPFPKNLHHLMIEVEDFNDVGLAYDRCLAAGFEVAMGLGHHPNDQMFSFYVVTPSGPLIELGHGGRIIDDSKWEVKTYSQLSDWGHAHG